MDLRPFDHINTCGYSELEVTQLANLGVTISTAELAIPVTNAILSALQK
jgi:lipoyl(octanoyl) transferase